MDSVHNSTQYIVQWPTWVSGLIALGLMAGLYSLVVEAVRRRWGLRGVWIAALGFAVALGIFVAFAMVRAAEPPSLVLGGVTLIITLATMFVAPAYGVSLGARRGQSGLLRQVGFGLLAAYGFAAIVLLLMLIIGVVATWTRR